MLLSQYASLRLCLVRDHGPLVAAHELFAAELRRVSLLWDEQWLSLVGRLGSDVDARVRTLGKDAHRLDKNTTLSVEDKV